jgi:hypothetical protein
VATLKQRKIILHNYSIRKKKERDISYNLKIAIATPSPLHHHSVLSDKFLLGDKLNMYLAFISHAEKILCPVQNDKRQKYHCLRANISCQSDPWTLL